MSLLAFLLRSSRGVVALCILVGVIGGASGVALIALVQVELTRPGAPGPAAAWAFAGLCLVTVLTRVVAQAAMVRLGQGAVAKLCLHLCRRILALPLERFEEVDPAGLVAVLTEDIVIVANALVGVPMICIHVPIVIACLAYAGWLSPAILACGIALAALAIPAHLVTASAGMRELRAARAKQDRLVAHFRTLIDGFRELKQHRRRREAFLVEALEPAAAAVHDRNAAGLTLFAVVEGWGQLAFFGFLGFLLFALPGLVDLGRPTLAGAVLVVLYIMTPLDILLTWLPVLGRARASLLKIQELIPTLEARGREDAIPPGGRRAFRDSIRLEGLSFAYKAEPDDGGFALGPVDLTLRAGELVFLVGGNGSGKTTLVKLLTGLYAPEAGVIYIDGRPVSPADSEAYRQLFSVVFADGHLFQDLLGLDVPGLDARVRDGLERMGLAGRVRVEEGSFTTLDLSQGQRRRLALLTALLEDRPVCVFDEWAANQDPHFKRIFYHELLPELRAAGKAVLVISHDEDYYDVADRVLRLRDGRVCDQTQVVAGGGCA